LVLCSPKTGSFKEILEHWALAGGPDDPMHWHHLSPEQQGKYNEQSKKKKIKNGADIERYIGLNTHGISLERLCQAYDLIFPQSRILVVKSAPEVHKNPYAERVHKKWLDHLEIRKSALIPDTPATSAIGQVLDNCLKTSERRRGYYNRLERAIIPAAYPHFEERIRTELLGVKSAVLNDAFYDEFQEFCTIEENGRERSAQIIASRDIRREWFPPELMGTPRRTMLDSILTVSFCPLDEINLTDIILFYDVENPEFAAFRTSVDKLEALHARSRAIRIPDSELSQVFEEHLVILRECVLTRLKARGQEHLIHESSAKVFLGSPESMIAGGGAGVASLTSAMASLAPVLGVAGQAAVTAVATWLYTFVLEKKMITSKWLEVETSLREMIKDEIQPPV